MKNVELRMIAWIVSEDPEKYKDGADSVTLVVNGIIISGVIIPKPTFLAQAQNTTLSAFHTTVDKVSEDLAPTEQHEEETDLEKYTRLYLKDAKYFVGSSIYPSNGGNYVAVNIDSVDAFNMFALEPTKSKF